MAITISKKQRIYRELNCKWNKVDFTKLVDLIVSWNDWADAATLQENTIESTTLVMPDPDMSNWTFYKNTYIIYFEGDADTFHQGIGPFTPQFMSKLVGDEFKVIS